MNACQVYKQHCFNHKWYKPLTFLHFGETRNSLHVWFLVPSDAIYVPAHLFHDNSAIKPISLNSKYTTHTLTVGQWHIQEGGGGHVFNDKK
jgi:hypothetical protein